MNDSFCEIFWGPAYNRRRIRLYGHFPAGRNLAMCLHPTQALTLASSKHIPIPDNSSKPSGLCNSKTLDNKATGNNRSKTLDSNKHRIVNSLGRIPERLHTRKGYQNLNGNKAGVRQENSGSGKCTQLTAQIILRMWPLKIQLLSNSGLPRMCLPCM